MTTKKEPESCAARMMARRARICNTCLHQFVHRPTGRAIPCAQCGAQATYLYADWCAANLNGAVLDVEGVIRARLLAFVANAALQLASAQARANPAIHDDLERQALRALAGAGYTLRDAVGLAQEVR